MSEASAIAASAPTAATDKPAGSRPEETISAEDAARFAALLGQYTQPPPATTGNDAANAVLALPDGASSLPPLTPNVTTTLPDGAATPGAQSATLFPAMTGNRLFPSAVLNPPMPSAKTDQSSLAGTAERVAVQDDIPEFSLNPAGGHTVTTDTLKLEPDVLQPKGHSSAGPQPDSVPASAVLAPLVERPSAPPSPALAPQHPRFAEGFSQQVVVLVQDGIQHARINLNPPELGPIEVRITMQHDQAQVQLAAHSAVARDAMQDALPRLREMMEQAGVRLGDTGVFAQLPQRGNPDSHQNAGSPYGNSAATELPFDAETEGHRVATSIGLGLVDAYV